MDKPLTITQAARAAKCSKSTMMRLIRLGTVPSEQAQTGQHEYRVLLSREELAKVYVPQRRRRPRRRPILMSSPNGHPGSLQVMLTLTAIPADKRELLIVLANKYTAAELKLLCELE